MADLIFPHRHSDDKQSSRRAPEHLNRTGCIIRNSDGKGRGVFAERKIDGQTLVEISPVLLFAKEEYETHGRHTLLDHYTFKWPDGRMALALGLGSLFNHSSRPNVSYTLDTSTDSIRYTTTRTIEPGEEMCIFYGHTLWFENADAGASGAASGEEGEDDGWGGLSGIAGPGEDGGGGEERTEGEMFAFPDGDPRDVIPEEELPFTRMKLFEEPEEETVEAVQTIQAWVVDLPDPRQTTTMLKWLKQSHLDDPALSHLKRVRKSPTPSTTLLLARLTPLTPSPPALPADLALPPPYALPVPKTAALTLSSCKVKSSLWPTVYAPRRKGELEDWERGRVRWACGAMQRAVGAAREARKAGELPIAAYVPIPYPTSKDEGVVSQGLTRDFVAYDTRKNTGHPLKHAVINVIRAVADYRAGSSSHSQTPSELTDASFHTSSSTEVPDLPAAKTEPDQRANGTHYLLTSLTLFTTHEPCIMCAMALLHSRVKEVVYLYPMRRTGGCGGAVCLPRLEGVNHRFGVVRWGKEGVLNGRELELDVGEDVDA